MICISVLTLLVFVSTTLSCRCPGAQGDLIAFTRLKGFYHHYGINIGNGYIVHLTGSKNELLQCFKTFFVRSSRCEIAQVKKEKCADVVKPGSGSLVYIEQGKWKDKKPLPEHEIVERALSKVGTSGYNLLFNNCEHFARWCRYGEEDSKQVNNLMLGLRLFLFLAVFPYVTHVVIRRLAILTFIMLVIALSFRALYLFFCSICEAMVEALRPFTSDTNFKKLQKKLSLLPKRPRTGIWFFPSDNILTDILIIHGKEKMNLLKREYDGDD